MESDRRRRPGHPAAPVATWSRKAIDASRHPLHGSRTVDVDQARTRAAQTRRAGDDRRRGRGDRPRHRPPGTRSPWRARRVRRVTRPATPGSPAKTSFTALCAADASSAGGRPSMAALLDEGAPVITTVSTVKDDLPRLERWIDRNLTAGVDRMLVFVDDRDDTQTAEALDARSRRGRRRRRDVVGRRLLAEAQRPATRQRQRGAGRPRDERPAGMAASTSTGTRSSTWTGSASWAWRTTSRRCCSSPLEALAQWEWPNDEVTVFKRLLADEELNLLHLLGRLERPDNSAYFRGHTVGKAGMRVSTDAWLDIHRVVDDSRTPVAAHRAPWLQVLHCESHTWRSSPASGRTTPPPVTAWSPGPSGAGWRPRCRRRGGRSGRPSWPTRSAASCSPRLRSTTARGWSRLGLLVTPALRSARPGRRRATRTWTGSRSSSRSSRAPTSRASGWGPPSDG